MIYKAKKYWIGILFWNFRHLLNLNFTGKRFLKCLNHPQIQNNSLNIHFRWMLLKNLKKKGNILNYIFCHFEFVICFAPLLHEVVRNNSRSWPEMGTYNASRILHDFLHVYYYVYYVLSFLYSVFFMCWRVDYLKYVFYS